eukprot:TRINITY_DN1818_c0_g1_i5.p1 TRINITY_DN1818_c0_g1~~TRINITY_DN1818_c0_g1_i5.p1  ORF type:complete len:397 (-),score=98.07 TRINITY_DN1818_c0_g1_i5:20-1210(-)
MYVPKDGTIYVDQVLKLCSSTLDRVNNISNGILSDFKFSSPAELESFLSSETSSEDSFFSFGDKKKNKPKKKPPVLVRNNVVYSKDDVGEFPSFVRIKSESDTVSSSSYRNSLKSHESDQKSNSSPCTPRQKVESFSTPVSPVLSDFKPREDKIVDSTSLTTETTSMTTTTTTTTTTTMDVSKDVIKEVKDEDEFLLMEDDEKDVKKNGENSIPDNAPINQTISSDTAPDNTALLESSTSGGEGLQLNSSSHSSTWNPILILVSTRIGLDKPNKIYFEHIRFLLSSRYCVGIVGGKPRASLYFIGIQGHDIIYLDPHFVQPSIPEDKPLNGDGLKTYHCKVPLKMPIDSIDPSLAVGILCRTEADFWDFRRTHTEFEQENAVMFSIVKDTPSYVNM